MHFYEDKLTYKIFVSGRTTIQEAKQKGFK